MNKTTSFNQDGETFSYALLCEALDKCSQSILLLNAEADIIYSTPHVEKISGYKAEDLIGTNAFKYFLQGDVPSAKEYHEILLGQADYTGSALVQVVHKNGHAIWIEAIAKNVMHNPTLNCILVFLRQSSDDKSRYENLITQSIIRAKEEEREFLATELHDNINQIISTSRLLIDAARTGGNREELLRLSSEHLQMATNEIRKLSHSMVSYDLQQFGLQHAVGSFVDTVSKGTGIFFTFLFEPGIEQLTSEQNLHLYRVIQESVNNIIKHAEASRVLIRISREEKIMTLLIEDNGKGFSFNDIKPGMGMASIRNRVKLLEGHLHITAPKGQGTSIEIHFPM
jgi:PAS domain S-box-containing protein